MKLFFDENRARYYFITTTDRIPRRHAFLYGHDHTCNNRDANSTIDYSSRYTHGRIKTSYEQNKSERRLYYARSRNGRESSDKNTRTLSVNEYTISDRRLRKSVFCFFFFNYRTFLLRNVRRPEKSLNRRRVVRETRKTTKRSSTKQNSTLLFLLF